MDWGIFLKKRQSSSNHSKQKQSSNLEYSSIFYLPEITIQLSVGYVRLYNFEKTSGLHHRFGQGSILHPVFTVFQERNIIQTAYYPYPFYRCIIINEAIMSIFLVER